MRISVSIMVAAAALLTPIVSADADITSRAGRIQVAPSPCLIAKLNPGTGPLCEPPAAENSAELTVLAASHLRAALFFLSIYDFLDARREIDAGLAARPDDFELLLLSARLAISSHEPATYDEKRAEQDIGRALKLKPHDSDARATYIESLRPKVSPSHLVREYDAVLAHDPKHDYARRARVMLLRELGRHGEALADLDVLLARDSDDAMGFTMRAASHIAMNELAAAVADFTSALRLEPNDFMALTGRAGALELLGDDDRALADYDTILGSVGGNPRFALGGDKLGKFWQQRAFVLVRLKRFKDAATDMAAALATEKSSVLRAQIFLRQNGFGELPLDGRDSPPLRTALQACFGLQSCFQRIQRGI